MISLCTVFDSNFIDRGLVLYDSLVETGSDFVLYVLCIDEKLYSALTRYNADRLKPVPLEKIMEKEPSLNELRKERSRSEFCWTLSSVFTEYVLNTYNPEEITYIDSDMYFYSDPFLWIKDNDKAVGITPHRFPKNHYFSLMEKHSGKYCVEFNSFKNNATGRKVLGEWKKSCLESCSSDDSEDGFGDQMYLTEWPVKYKGDVYVYSYPGAGIATWNIMEYALDGDVLTYRGEPVTPVFYHFSGLRFTEDGKVCVKCGDFGRRVADYFYISYLKKLEEKRVWVLKEYGIETPRYVEGVGNMADNRAQFVKKIKKLLSRGKLISAAREVINRLYISRYSRKHFGTEADYYDY